LGYKSKLDHNKIELFVKDNPDSKLSSIGARFGISKSHAGLILKKLGFSYKKKPSPMWKQAKESEIDTKKK
jgi:transposase